MGSIAQAKAPKRLRLVLQAGKGLLSIPLSGTRPMTLRILALCLPVLLLSGCGGGFFDSSVPSILDPVGPIGTGNRTILLNSLAVMLVIVIPTMIATVAFAWWFRASNPKAEYKPGFTYSGRIELIVWSIPTLTILFLGGLIWYGSHQLDPRRPVEPVADTLEVQVVALDWKWLFIYPGTQVATVNDLKIPVGQPVRFRVTSASVMTTFFIPRLGSMIYGMNRMENELHLRADHAGNYFGTAAHYSGDGFSGMNFNVEAMPPDAFGRWLTGLHSGGDVLNAQAYAELSRQSHDVKPFHYSQVQNGLFDAIVRQVLPPAPGPDEGRQGDPGVHPESPASEVRLLDGDICTASNPTGTKG